MARIRTIKPEFFTSLTVASVRLEARMTFIGLWTHVDDSGRCVDDTRLIRAALWALDDRTLGDVEDDLKALDASKLIRRYDVDGRRYLEVLGWGEHQKISHPTPSKLPPPPEVPDKPPTSANTPSPESSGTSLELFPRPPELLAPERKGKEQGKEGKGVSTFVAADAATANQRRATRIPDDFAVTPAMRTWAQANTPDVDLRYETDQFLDYWRSKPGKAGLKLDWRLTWNTWIRKAQRDRLQRNHSTAGRANGWQPYRNPDNPETAYNGYKLGGRGGDSAA